MYNLGQNRSDRSVNSYEHQLNQLLEGKELFNNSDDNYKEEFEQLLDSHQLYNNEMDEI